jgi:Flp pilus assembly protein TadD
MKALLIGGCAAALAAGAAITAAAQPAPAGSDSGAPYPAGTFDPHYDPVSEHARAIAAINAKHYWQAATAASHMTDAVPKDPEGWRLLGAAEAGENDWKGSRRAYEMAVKLAPDDAATHAGLGLVLANLKDPKAQAELDWLKARAQACAGSCADADKLKGFSDMVQGAMTPSTHRTPKPIAAS